MTKRKFWFKYGLPVAVSILIIASGCGATGVTAAEIAVAVEASADDLRTFKFGMTIKEFVLMPETSMMGAIDTENGRMKLEIEMTVLGTRIRTGMYVLDNIMYIVAEEDGQSEWMKMALTPEEENALWDTDNPVGEQLALFERSIEWNKAEDETVDGMDCYVVKIVPDLNLLWETLDMDGGFVEDEITDMTMRFWFAKDTFFIVKMDLSMGIEGVDADFEYEMVLYDHNEPVSVELPPEAESAVWID